MASAQTWKYEAGTPPLDQNWNNSDNWIGGVPGGGFFIRNITGGLLPVIDGNLAATANGNSFIGAFSATNSRLDIRSGGLAITGTLLVGPDSGTTSVPSSGTLNIANTATLDATNLTGYALGTGSLSTTGVLTLARRKDSVGVLNINTTGSVSAGSSQILVGGGGIGTVNLVNGSFNTTHFAGGLVLGGVNDGGTSSVGNGTFNMSGGSMGDGTANQQRFIRVGREGTGEFNQSGGAVNIGNDLEIGVNAGSSGTVNLSGGTTSLNITRVGMSGSGTLNISGSAAVTGRNFNDALIIGANAGGSGTVNLDEGSLTLRSVKGGVGESTFNFNGGSLVFTSFYADAFQGLTEANILAGGAFINTNGNNVGIGQVLQGDGDLTKLGSGTLTLAGANISTGGLHVQEGTLSITSAFIDMAATVSIASGALLDLNYTGDNIIAGLILDGVAMGTGTYDSSSSFLTGTGTLTVIPEPTSAAMLGLLFTVVLLRRRRA
jgi:autotransporter-associated beta strand protein/T5SS/PEP-CTERM-associated repeat protein